LWRPRGRKLLPAFRAIALGRKTIRGEHLESEGIDRSLRMAPSGERIEASQAELVQEGLGHNRASRVAGAKEEDVVGPVDHELRSSSPESDKISASSGPQSSGRPPQQSFARKSITSRKRSRSAR